MYITQIGTTYAGLEDAARLQLVKVHNFRLGQEVFPSRRFHQVDRHSNTPVLRKMPRGILRWGGGGGSGVINQNGS